MNAELNIAVAEAIGYRDGDWQIERTVGGVRTGISATPFENGWSYDHASVMAAKEEAYSGGGWKAVPLDFDPEHDLNQAWEAGRKCAKQSMPDGAAYFSLVVCDLDPTGCRASIQYVDSSKCPHNKTGWEILGHGDTPAAAICNAILAARGRG